MMQNGLILVVVLFFVLGSAVVSTMDLFSSTFRSFFYVLAITVLVTIGLANLDSFFRNNNR